MPVNDTNSSQPNPFDPNATPPLARQDMDRIQQMSNWQKRFDIRGPGVTMKNSADACTIYIQGTDNTNTTKQKSPAVLIKLSSATTFTPSGGSPITLGGGRYVGTVWNLPTTDATLSGNLSDADLGTAGVTCLVYNIRESGQSTRSLVTTAGVLPQFFFGYPRKPYSDGTPVYAIDGIQDGC